ncbi:hypothetical protein J2853_000193 [Streptosporangium lutulentum]|uniref:Uncharacterized protein n=1 Tax=Streptosporangium lutulentum TaxID=1461250 RepID=A0ABT9Q2Q2_9ACTN|nr:hypothetical protein [Streptosporangium lutulentum]
MPDPDDAREPDAIRIRVSAVLRRDAFECETGAACTPMRAFGRIWTGDTDHYWDGERDIARPNTKPS